MPRIRATIVVAMLKVDVHDIGETLYLMFRNYGYNVIDLGKMYLPGGHRIPSKGASIIGLSALMTTNYDAYKDVAELQGKELSNT